MFDKAGVAYPTKDWTWKEFLDAAEKLTVRNGDTVEVYGFAAGDWWPWWMSFIYMNGGAILDANGKPVANSPEAIEAMQFYQDLVYKYKVAPSPEDYANMGQSGPDPVFAQGKAAMSMTGFWAVNSLSTINELNWDIAPLFGNKTNATVLFGSGLAVAKGCKYPEQAFKVIHFAEKCVGCKMCLRSCPWEVISFDSDRGKATKCFLCYGKPKCVEACPAEVLNYMAWHDLTDKILPRVTPTAIIPMEKAAACNQCHKK